MKNEQKILELLLEVLNLMYMHRGNIGELNYKEMSKKITDLYQELAPTPELTDQEEDV